MNLMIVDDELSMRELLEFVFHSEGYTVFTAESIAAAGELLRQNRIDILISDLKLGDGNGLDLLQQFHESCPDAIFILITAYASADSAINALKFGAYDYITKPFDVEELKRIVQSAADKFNQQKEHQTVETGVPEKPMLIGASPAMIKIYKTIGVIAPTDSTILLTGESGTGKEMIARAIHESGPRKSHSFVSINCGAFPETLLESELFGYQKGAFTGAVGNKRGLFEVAHRGTLFLDEIAETTPAMQVKLLRSIQEKKIRRLGSTEEIPIDVRIIAATNKDLAEQISRGSFREDLYYRLAVIPIHLPPLRERAEDIPAMARYFLTKFNLKMGKFISGFDPTVSQLLLKYEWKGNVRELENVIERAVALETTDKIQTDRLPPHIQSVTGYDYPEVSAVVELPAEGLNLDGYMESVERNFVLQALERTGGVQIEAARVLQITYRSLRHRMQKFGISS